MNGVIEDDIPIPPRRSGLGGQGGRGLIYPWAKMRPGQSVLIPTPEYRNRQQQQTNLLASIRGWKQRNGIDREYTTRVVEGGIRIWRTR